mgnify:CR=1 FL=1
MGTVKVVLGFIELALSLKFLSVADLAYGWHILDREVFLCLWIAMFGLLGAYLMGWFNFKHYGPADSSIGLVRFFIAMVSFAFAMYLVPGLGVRLSRGSVRLSRRFTRRISTFTVTD